MEATGSSPVELTDELNNEDNYCTSAIAHFLFRSLYRKYNIPYTILKDVIVITSHKGIMPETTAQNDELISAVRSASLKMDEADPELTSFKKISEKDHSLEKPSRVNYFRRLTDSQVFELNEFEDFLKMNASPVNEVEEAIAAKPQEQFYVLGIQGSPIIDILRSKHKNLVQFTQGYEEQGAHGHHKEGIDDIENYVDFLLAQKKNIIFVVPENFFTFFNNKKGEVLATIREFEYLMDHFPDDPELIHFVYSPSKGSSRNKHS